MDQSHYHTFELVRTKSLPSGSIKCNVCRKSLNNNNKFWKKIKNKNSNNDKILKCTACGYYSHQSCCILDKKSITPCAVNKAIKIQAMQEEVANPISMNDKNKLAVSIQKLDFKTNHEKFAFPLMKDKGNEKIILSQDNEKSLNAKIVSSTTSPEKEKCEVTKSSDSIVTTSIDRNISRDTPEKSCKSLGNFQLSKNKLSKEVKEDKKSDFNIEPDIFNEEMKVEEQKDVMKIDLNDEFLSIIEQNLPQDCPLKISPLFSNENFVVFSQTVKISINEPSSSSSSSSKEKSLELLDDKYDLVWDDKGPPSPHWALDNPRLLKGLRSDSASHSSSSSSFPKVKKLTPNGIVDTTLLETSIEFLTKEIEYIKEFQKVGNPSNEISPLILSENNKRKQDLLDNNNSHNINSNQNFTNRNSFIKNATIAGGVLGSLAGLVVTGPIGAYIGSNESHAAAGLSLYLILEGSLCAIGLRKGESTSIKEDEKEHQSTNSNAFLSSNNIKNILSNKIPNVITMQRCKSIIEPEWEEVHSQIKQKYTVSPTPKPSRSFILPLYQLNFDILDKRKQHELIDIFAKKESDYLIINADESEISYREKVVILVSRMINDKTSLLGKMYRGLIDTYNNRAVNDDFKRNKVHIKQDEDEEIELQVLESEDTREKKNTSNINQNKYTSTKRRRIDALTVLHFVTMTLFEERPKIHSSVNSSTQLTRLCLLEIEKIVLNELHDSIMEAIRFETFKYNKMIERKIKSFHHQWSKNVNSVNTSVSEEEKKSKQAIDELQTISSVRTATEKLNSCIRFLNLLSCKNALYNDGSKESHELQFKIKMDDLMKVCKHVILAKIPHLYAEIVFILEFLRYDILSRSDICFTLITMQTALSYLVNFDLDQQQQQLQQ